MSAPVALVTGAASGIGRACAHLLRERGYTVYGASRRAAANAAIDAHGVIPLRMDVTDDESVKSAIGLLIEREGRLDVIVNSAGWGIAGAAEDVSAAEAAAQIDVLALGVVRVCAAALPHMRTQGYGRVINIGSVAGLLTVPYQSAYSAGKYALEALTEAYRMELKPFGVQFALVEPGDTKTDFTGARIYAERALESSVYRDRCRGAIKIMEESEQKGRAPQSVARVVMRLLERRRMPIRRVVGLEYKLIAVLKRVLPARLVEALVSAMYTAKG